MFYRVDDSTTAEGRRVGIVLQSRTSRFTTTSGEVSEPDVGFGRIRLSERFGA